MEIVSASRISPQDHVGILAHGGAHALGERGQVRAELALDDLALLAAMHELVGSSRLTMLRLRVEFSKSIIAARVVDLPVPVEPVTRIMPWWCRTAGSPRAAAPGSRCSDVVRDRAEDAPTAVLAEHVHRKRPPSSLT